MTDFDGEDKDIKQLLEEIIWEDQANEWLDTFLGAVFEMIDAGSYYGPEFDKIVELVDAGKEAGYIADGGCDCEDECERPDNCVNDESQE